MVAQARRYPELCQQARSKLVGASAGRLPTFFETLIERGRMRPVNTALAANTFALVVVGGLRPLFSVTESDEVTRQRVEMEIALFVEGWGIDTEPPTDPEKRERTTQHRLIPSIATRGKAPR